MRMFLKANALRGKTPLSDAIDFVYEVSNTRSTIRAEPVLAAVFAIVLRERSTFPVVLESRTYDCTETEYSSLKDSTPSVLRNLCRLVRRNE